MALQHLRSSTASKRPTPGGMSDGQLALNTNSTSPGLFFKDSNGALVKVGPVHVGTTAPNASPAVGGSAGNAVGEQWLDTTGGTYVLKIWDGSAWRSETGTFVDAAGDVMTGALGVIAGTAAAPGLYISGDTNTGIYSPGADLLSITTGGTERFRVDANGQLHAVSLGAAATPTFSFTTDTNTGIYSPGADQVAISTGGSGRLFVDGSGNVSIKGSSTNGVLSIEGTSSAQIHFRESGSGTKFIYTTASDIEYRNNSVGSQIWYTSSSERLRITSTGLVGIGTSSPVSNLHVNSGGNTLATISSSFSGSVETGLAVDTTGDSSRAKLEFQKSGAGRGSIFYFHNASGASERLGFNVSGTEGLSVLGSGRVGIGTTSPVARLHVSQGADSNIIQYIQGASNGIRLGTNTNAALIDGVDATNGSTSYQPLFLNGSDLRLGSGGAERARIDSSGRLLVGTSTAFGTSSTIEAHSSTQFGPQLLLRSRAADAFGPYFIGQKIRSTSSVQSGDYLSVVEGQGYDGSAYISAARLSIEVDGTPGVNDMPGRLVFSTTADGASSPTERMRITSTGQVRLAGAGITFNGDTATANELDDYEEGTFTPTIIGTTTAGTGTYSIQIGRYTKIGNRVDFSIRIVWSAHTGTGNFRIAGLPFTSVNITSARHAVYTATTNLTTPAGTIPQATINPATTEIIFESLPTGGGVAANLAMDTAADILATGCYEV